MVEPGTSKYVNDSVHLSVHIQAFAKAARFSRPSVSTPFGHPN